MGSGKIRVHIGKIDPFKIERCLDEDLENRSYWGCSERFGLCLKVIYLGIALGSAVKTAADLNIDNRMLYTMGAAAKELGLLDADVFIGIPLSVSGKNILFDRIDRLLSSSDSDKVLIRPPYDVSPISEKDQVVMAMDRSGAEVCDAVLERVTKTQSKTCIIFTPPHLYMSHRHRIPPWEHNLNVMSEEDFIEKFLLLTSGTMKGRRWLLISS